MIIADYKSVICLHGSDLDTDMSCNEGILILVEVTLSVYKPCDSHRSFNINRNENVFFPFCNDIFDRKVG